MAQFRQVHTSFWHDDPTVETWTFEQKSFFIYLITNPHSKQCGITELTIKQITNETGLSEEKALELLSFFEKAGKIIYNPETKEVAMKNWFKYNPRHGSKTETGIKRELKSVKDSGLIDFVEGREYPFLSKKCPIFISNTPIEVTEKEKEKDKEKEREKEGFDPLSHYDYVLTHLEYYMQTTDYTGSTKDARKLTNKVFDYVSTLDDSKKPKDFNALIARATLFAANER